jgi:hypothetical protein
MRDTLYEPIAKMTLESLNDEDSEHKMDDALSLSQVRVRHI